MVSNSLRPFCVRFSMLVERTAVSGKVCLERPVTVRPLCADDEVAVVRQGSMHPGYKL